MLMQVGKIDTRTAALMIIVALGIDSLEAFLTSTIAGAPASVFIDFAAWALFALWFWRLGVPRWGGVSLAAFVEFVPLIGALPFWTVYVIVAVLQSRKSPAAE